MTESEKDIRAIIQHWECCPTDNDIEARCICNREERIAQLVRLVRECEKQTQLNMITKLRGLITEQNAWAERWINERVIEFGELFKEQPK